MNGSLWPSRVKVRPLVCPKLRRSSSPGRCRNEASPEDVTCILADKFPSGRATDLHVHRPVTWTGRVQAVPSITSQRLRGTRSFVAKVRGRTSRGEAMSLEVQGRVPRATWQVTNREVQREERRAANVCRRKVPSARSQYIRTFGGRVQHGTRSVARSTRGPRSPWRPEVRGSRGAGRPRGPQKRLMISQGQSHAVSQMQKHTVWMTYSVFKTFALRCRQFYSAYTCCSSTLGLLVEAKRSFFAAVGQREDTMRRPTTWCFGRDKHTRSAAHRASTKKSPQHRRSNRRKHVFLFAKTTRTHKT